jgi:hypothetical protein
MICCTTVAIFNVSLLVKLGACTDRPVLWISCCGRCCYMWVHKLIPYVCGTHGCCCWVPWHRAAAKDCSGEVNLEKNVLPEDPLGARCALLLSSSPFAWLQPRYDAGWCFSPSTRVQLQQLSVDSVFVFSGHSLCSWPPPHNKHLGGCLQLAQTWSKFWQW